MRIGEVNLDDRLIERLKRIIERDRGVAVGGGVDDDAAAASARFLDPVDQFALVVGLAEDGREAVRLRPARPTLSPISASVVRP